MKFKFVISGLFFLTFHPMSYASDQYDQEIIKNCKSLNNIIKKANTYYQNQAYGKALKHFEEQAAWLDFCSIHEETTGNIISESQLVTAYNNVGISHAKLKQPRWARAWYSIQPKSSKSQFNLKALPHLNKPSNQAGTYAKYIGQGVWNVINVSPNGKNYDIEYQGYRMGANGMLYGPNMGEFSTVMLKSSYQAQYTYEDCKIELNFVKDLEKIEVHQSQSDCGFGMGVYAGGTYLRVENPPQ